MLFIFFTGLSDVQAIHELENLLSDSDYEEEVIDDSDGDPDYDVKKDTRQKRRYSSESDIEFRELRPCPVYPEVESIVYEMLDTIVASSDENVTINLEVKSVMSSIVDNIVSSSEVVVKDILRDVLVAISQDNRKKLKRRRTSDPNNWKKNKTKKKKRMWETSF